jgi:hypothetical protein
MAALVQVRAARTGCIVGERRSFPRPSLYFRALLKVQKGDGTAATIKVRGSDLTKFGAKVISDYPIPPGSVVIVEFPTYQLMGVGHVLHCKPHWLKHCIGMEFRSELMRTYDGEWKLSVVKQPSADPVWLIGAHPEVVRHGGRPR